MDTYLCYEFDVCLSETLANSQQHAEAIFMIRFGVTSPECPFTVVKA